MNFGEKLKQLRQLQNLSQPELAAAIGIEQSYLSKLENDKSSPSPEMLSRILGALDITLDEILDDIDDGEIRDQLNAIPQVLAHKQHRESLTARNRNVWLALSAVFFSLGFGFLIAGSGAYLFPEIAFNYQSEELVPKGDNGEIFESIGSFLDYKFAPVHSELMRSDASEKEIELAWDLLGLDYANLSLPEYVLSYENRGIAYTEDVVSAPMQDIMAATGLPNGATRTFKLNSALQGPQKQPRPINGQLRFAGITLLLLGLMGFLTRIFRFFAELMLYQSKRRQLS